MKKAGKGTLLLVTALSLSLCLAGYLWAQPTKRPKRGGMNMTPEQAAQVFDLKEKFNADTVSLRREMAIKRAEFEALALAEKPDKNAIQAKQKELNVLKEQFQEKAKAFQEEVKKIAPDSRTRILGIDEGRSSGFPPGMGHGVPPPPPPVKQ